MCSLCLSSVGGFYVCVHYQRVIVHFEHVTDEYYKRVGLKQMFIQIDVKANRQRRFPASPPPRIRTGNVCVGMRILTPKRALAVLYLVSDGVAGIILGTHRTRIYSYSTWECCDDILMG